MRKQETAQWPNPSASFRKCVFLGHWVEVKVKRYSVWSGEWIILCPVDRCPSAKHQHWLLYLFWGKTSCSFSWGTVPAKHQEGNTGNSSTHQLVSDDTKAEQRGRILSTFPYMMRWMVRVCNSTMSPGFLLNSPFHSVPVKGDYKLSKKNEILVDLFLNTLFQATPPSSHTISPSSILILSSNQVCPSLSLFYFSLSAHRFSRSRGQVRGHLAPPRCRAWATWRQRPPLLELCRSVPNFHLHPLPSSLSVKKTPAGMLQWGGCECSRLRGSKVWMLSWGESHWELISERKVGNKGGDAPLLWPVDKDAQRRRGNLYGHHFFATSFDIIGWWAALFGCQDLFSQCV